MSTKVLFACSKCFSRHPFEELSAGQQLCKDCRGAPQSLAKCNYCRSEFQQSSKSGTSSVCSKCEQNVKQYGKPSACECCSIIAAFIGSKCQRCANSELKYGPPVQCDQCKQRSAFDRHDESKKIDGKLLCYLCTSSYKRALLKARQVKEEARMSKKRAHPSEKVSSKESGGSAPKKSSSQRSELSSKQQSSSSDVPEKISRQTASNNGGLAGLGGITAAAVVTIDPNSSDHVVAMTDLREQIASLQKKLAMKDKELLEKDKLITELKGRNFDNANDMRNKLRETERIYDMKVDLLNKKVASLLKEVASLKKGQKKNGTTGSNAVVSAISSIDQKESSKDSGGSATNSPVTN
ncbi:unnamed protein product [Hermetia illucens]|uniref:Protein FAM76A n=1 Tax=Hermetia illucens TaxID=343691 RepID=A0A7R8ULD9_HERIL|nr:protein FAM76A [Hermetia illucens]CAD7082177.1 unnamed protein product [Hermetia illucens]